MPSHEAPERHAAEDHEGEQGDADRPHDMLDRASTQIGAETHQGGPGDAADRVEHHEAMRLEPVHAGEDRRIGPQHRREAAEEDDLPAVLLEHVLAELEAAMVEADDVPVPQQERQAEPASGPVAEIVAEDRGRHRGADDDPDVELARRAGIDGGGQKDRLARQRQAGTLEQDHAKDGEITVMGNQIGDLQV